MEWNFNLVLVIFSSSSFFLFQKGFKLDMIYETQVSQIKWQYLYKESLSTKKLQKHFLPHSRTQNCSDSKSLPSSHTLTQGLQKIFLQKIRRWNHDGNSRKGKIKKRKSQKGKHTSFIDYVNPIGQPVPSIQPLGAQVFFLQLYFWPRSLSYEAYYSYITFPSLLYSQKQVFWGFSNQLNDRKGSLLIHTCTIKIWSKECRQPVDYPGTLIFYLNNL